MPCSPWILLFPGAAAPEPGGLQEGKIPSWFLPQGTHRTKGFCHGPAMGSAPAPKVLRGPRVVFQPHLRDCSLCQPCAGQDAAVTCRGHGINFTPFPSPLTFPPFQHQPPADLQIFREIFGHSSGVSESDWSARRSHSPCVTWKGPCYNQQGGRDVFRSPYCLD